MPARALWVPSTGSRKMVPLSPPMFSRFPHSSETRVRHRAWVPMYSTIQSSAAWSICRVGVPLAPVRTTRPPSGRATRSWTISSTARAISSQRARNAMISAWYLWYAIQINYTTQEDSENEGTDRGRQAEGRQVRGHRRGAQQDPGDRDIQAREARGGQVPDRCRGTLRRCEAVHRPAGLCQDLRTHG